MDNNELCIVDVNGNYGWTYDFCTEEDKKEKLASAYAQKAKSLTRMKEAAKKYPHNAEYLNRCIEKLSKEEYDVITYGEFLRRQKDVILSAPVSEITEEDYENAMSELPPIKWCVRAGFELFCMPEMLTGSYTAQYAKFGDRFYSATVDVLDESTWIHNRMAA